MSVTLAPPGALTRLSGQGHKRVFGRWNALCFLATHRFSSRASSRSNTSHRHGLNRLGAGMKGLFYGKHQPLEDSLFWNSHIRPSHTLLSTIESDRHFQFAFVLVTDAINRQNDHPPSTTLFAPLGGHPRSLHVLGFHV